MRQPDLMAVPRCGSPQRDTGFRSDTICYMERNSAALRPRLVAVADLTKENLQAMIRDMDAQPGWHLAADLYAWYESMAREAELAPVSRKKFGMVMAELGFRSSVRRVGGQPGRRCWFLPRHAIRAAQEAAK